MQDLETTRLIEHFHDGLEKHDLDSFMECYDDNALVRVIDQNNPPTNPKVLRGKQEIRQFYSDILTRDIEHRIEMEAVGNGVAAFSESCTYPNGLKVVTTDMCQLRDGRISNQMTVQVWDH